MLTRNDNAAAETYTAVRDEISILDGSTFLVSDRRGAIEATPDRREPAGVGDGAPLLLVCALLALEPESGELRADPFLPEAIGRIGLTRVPGRWGRTDLTTKEAVA